MTIKVSTKEREMIANLLKGHISELKELLTYPQKADVKEYLKNGVNQANTLLSKINNNESK